MAGVAAIVVAGGRGSRVGGAIPKQFRRLAGEPVIRTSLAMFASHPEIARVQPVIHRDDSALYATAIAGLDLAVPVFGGDTRQASVLAGLEAVAPDTPDVVLVHDAARPFASAALTSRAIAAARANGAAVPALSITDTVKLVDQTGRVQQTVDRTTLRIVQTPQAFAFAPLYDAHRKAAESGRQDFTDDAALAEWAGLKVQVFEGEADNIKLTSAEDFNRAELIKFAALGDLRTAQGVDVHAFGPGDHVMLGGVRIENQRGLSGHSDADVVLHALVDAILGALADGDIGSHFPPSDPRWRGVSSDRFLKYAAARVTARGGHIVHLDVSIVCETPRIGPHRDAMRARIAELAGLAVDRVAVKATTSEGLGFTGRNEGIAAFATATIRLPWSAP